MRHKWHRSPTMILKLGVTEFNFFLVFCFVFYFCTQIDGSRLFKDVKAYYTAVKGRFDSI